MKNLIAKSVGWKKSQFLYSQHQLQSKKQSDRPNLWLSVILMVVIVFIFAQILSVAAASAASNEAMLLSLSHREIIAQPGQTVKVKVGFKNLSNNIWLAGGTNQTKLAFKINPPYERTSIFYNQSWKKTSSPAYLISGDTKPGEIGYFEFNLTAPKTVGTYKEKFVLAINAVPLTGSEIELSMKVATASVATTQASLIDSPQEITAQPGKTVKVKVSFKNLTKKTWLAGGTNQTKLAFKIKPPYERTSIFYNTSWKKTSSPAYLISGDTKPGQIGYFEFTLTAPQKEGTYKENFVLAINAVPLTGSEIELVMNVANQTQVAKTADTVNGQKKLEKVIAETTDVCTKNTSHTQYTATFLQEVRPFCETLYAEDQIVIPDKNKNSNDTPAEGGSASGGNNNTQVTVAEPIIRVGIYKPESSVIIKAEQDYKIVDKNGSILMTVPANMETQASFNYTTKQYTYLANGQSATTSSYLRFEPVIENTVFIITTYEDRPSWNKTINYNQFLGKLEIRYAEANDKIWVINELPVETYLKGMAETSNAAPMEYMKALVTSARTYVMYHYNRGTKHADRHFTVDAYYDQVYKGYSAQKVLPRLSEAVEATRGRVVTYAGVVVVTPYYSHSDGRTRSWGEVWGNGDKYPWCMSVKEPEGFDKDYMFGHGVGLSARGAIILDVDLHYTWENILKYYFTGIEVGTNYGIK